MPAQFLISKRTMSSQIDYPPLVVTPHSFSEDAQAIITGCLFFALSITFFRETRMLTGGTSGLSFIIHYLSHWPFGLILFAINLPFYVFAWQTMGRPFTIKTFISVSLLATLAEIVPSLVSFEHLNPIFSAVMAGLLGGIGILILIRHGASLGGLNVMCLYLQKKKGWRAGVTQLLADVCILSLGLLAVPPEKVLLSILSAMALNLVIGVNHRSGRYFGF